MDQLVCRSGSGTGVTLYQNDGAMQGVTMQEKDNEGLREAQE